MCISTMSEFEPISTKIVLLFKYPPILLLTYDPIPVLAGVMNGTGQSKNYHIKDHYQELSGHRRTGGLQDHFKGIGAELKLRHHPE